MEKTSHQEGQDIFIWAIISASLFALYIWGLSEIPDVVNENYNPNDWLSNKTETSYFKIFLFSFLPATFHVISSLIYHSIKNGKNEFHLGRFILAYLLNLALLGVTAFVAILLMKSFFSFLIISLLFAGFHTLIIGIPLKLTDLKSFFLINMIITGLIWSLAFHYNNGLAGKEYYFFGIAALWQFLSTLTISPNAFERHTKSITKSFGMVLIVLSFILGMPHWIESYQEFNKTSIQQQWYKAIKEKDQKKMKEVLDTGEINISHIHNQWTTAIFKNDLKSVETFAKYTKDFDKQLLQMSLPRVQTPEMAELLIHLGDFPKSAVSTNHEYYGIYLPALFQIEDTTILQIYINNGANVNDISQVIGFENSTPLDYAIKKDQKAKVQFLLNHGATPSEKD